MRKSTFWQYSIPVLSSTTPVGRLKSSPMRRQKEGHMMENSCMSNTGVEQAGWRLGRLRENWISSTSTCWIWAWLADTDCASDIAGACKNWTIAVAGAFPRASGWMSLYPRRLSACKILSQNSTWVGELPNFWLQRGKCNLDIWRKKQQQFS